MLLAIVWWILASTAGGQVVPKIVPMQGEIRLNRGQRYQVTCTTSQGNPPLNFHWLRNGQPLVSNSRLTLRRLDDFTSALHIPSVTTDDVANFTCLASNQAGSDSFMTTLVVMVKPEWVRPPYDQVAVVGQKVTLECEASGSPAPIVMWIRDGRPVGAGTWHLGEVGRLSHPAVKLEDAGEYTCMADNGLGSALTKTITLQVQAGPSVEMNVNDSEVPSGGRLEIQCQARGDPPLRVTWRHRKHRLSDGSENNRVRITENMWSSSNVTSVLTVDETLAEDTGVYTCMAHNSVAVASRQVLVLILAVPQQPATPRLVRVWSRSALVRWAGPVHAGNKPVTEYRVTWQAAGGRASDVFVNVTSLVLRELLPAADHILRVEARNAVGHGPPSDALRFRTLPDVPAAPSSDLRLDESLPDALKISWKVPEIDEWHGDLKGFLVGCRETGPEAGGYLFATVPPKIEENRQSFVLGPLRPLTAYRIVIRAFNSAGLGPPTPTISATTTGPDAPSLPLLVVTSTTHEAVRFKVDAEPFTRLTVHLRSSRMDWRRVRVQGQDPLVGGLDSGTWYEAYITASNTIATSGPSEVVRFFTDYSPRRTFYFPEEDSFYLRLTFVVPLSISVTLILLLPCIACCLFHKIKYRHRPSGGVKAQGFTYASASLPHALPSHARNNALVPYPVYGEDAKYEAINHVTHRSYGQTK